MYINQIFRRFPPPFFIEIYSNFSKEFSKFAEK